MFTYYMCECDSDIVSLREIGHNYDLRVRRTIRVKCANKADDYDMYNDIVNNASR